MKKELRPKLVQNGKCVDRNLTNAIHKRTGQSPTEEFSACYLGERAGCIFTMAEEIFPVPQAPNNWTRLSVPNFEMSAVYTSGLGTYLWDGVNHSQTGQASAVGSLLSSSSAQSGNTASIDIASISDRAQLFSGLETLSSTSPARFQKNTATIAEYLRSAAASAEDPEQSGFLTRTASTFEQASQTGAFSDLFLQEGHGFGSGEPEPYAVSQIFSHVLTQVSTDVQSSKILTGK